MTSEHFDIISDSPINDPTIIAKNAVNIATGGDNDYLQRLLENKIRGKKKKYKSIPIRELLHQKKYNEIEETLKDEIDVSQQNTSELFENQSMHRITNVPQDISKWIINTILDEKLQYRKVQEKSDRWKIFNGILAIILPILTPLATNLLQYYITNKCSPTSTNSTSP